MKFLTLDFEGSLKNGVREIGAVYAEDNKIKSYEDKVIQNEEECIKVLTNIVDYKPNVFISHNVHVEKNLLKSYLPYKRFSSNSLPLEWGPWLDTKTTYRTLYPKISTYDLKFLTETFVKKSASKLSGKFCTINKRSHHNALYDALCTYLLFERIKDKVNINKFIQ